MWALSSRSPTERFPLFSLRRGNGKKKWTGRQESSEILPLAAELDLAPGSQNRRWDAELKECRGVVPVGRPTAGLLLHLKAVRLAAGDFEAAHLFKYQLCSHKRQKHEGKVKSKGEKAKPAQLVFRWAKLLNPFSVDVLWLTSAPQSQELLLVYCW